MGLWGRVGSTGALIALVAAGAVLLDAEGAEKSKRLAFKESARRGATMGVRGLDDVALRDAKPAPERLAVIEKWVEEARLAKGFDRPGRQLRLVGVEVPAPPPEPEAALGDEIAVGREIAAALVGAAAPLNQPDLQRYVNQVGLWVAARSERPGLPWRFGVLDDPSLNAFAIPGGWVFVTSGLLQRMQSESELASVLAHEIAHVTARHHYKLLLVEKALEQVGAMMKRLPGGAGAVMSKMAGGGCRILARALDRQAEDDADRMAVVLAADSGYAPKGLLGALGALVSRAKKADPTMSLLLKTHPSPESRVRTLRQWMSEPGSRRLATLNGRPLIRDRFIQSAGPGAWKAGRLPAESSRERRSN